MEDINKIMLIMDVANNRTLFIFKEKHIVSAHLVLATSFKGNTNISKSGNIIQTELDTAENLIFILHFLMTLAVQWLLKSLIAWFSQ